MSAEGVGIVLGFATLFVTLVGLAVAGGVAYGTIKTMVLSTATKLSLMDTDNKQGHKEIFECQKETDIKVSKIEQHLLSINGNIQNQASRINDLEKESHPH